MNNEHAIPIDQFQAIDVKSRTIKLIFFVAQIRIGIRNDFPLPPNPYGKTD